MPRVCAVSKLWMQKLWKTGEVTLRQWLDIAAELLAARRAQWYRMLMKRVLILLLSAGAVVLLNSCDAKARSAAPSLQSAATEWCPQNALTLAEASALAYDSGAAEKVKAALQCESCEMFSLRLELPGKFEFEEGEPGPQAFIAAGKQHVVLAFRGTEVNVIDILTDAWAQPVAFGDGVPGVVHGGFRTTFAGIWPELEPRLKLARERFPEAKLWITGHSLGGALAVMAATELALVDKVPVQGVITYGAPVTGDAEFHKALTAALGEWHWRVVHERDLVTLDLASVEIPFVKLPGELTRLRHGGKPVWLHSDGSLSGDDDGTAAMAADVLTFALKWIKSREWEPPDYHLQRHSMRQGYLPALRKMQEKSPSGKLPGQ